MLPCSVFKRKLHWCVSSTPAPPLQLLLSSPLTSGKGTRLSDQHILAAAGKELRIAGGAGGGREEDFSWLE